jgi:hypothetical protein
MRNPRTPAAALAFLLAACSSAGAAPPLDDRGDWWPGTSSVLEKEEFPPAFRGTWGLTAAACADRDAKERIDIHRQGIDLYEMGARLQQITAIGDRLVRVRVLIEGESLFDEGEWRLGISPARDRLTLAQSPDAEDQVWVRCR